VVAQLDADLGDTVPGPGDVWVVGNMDEAAIAPGLLDLGAKLRNHGVEALDEGQRLFATIGVVAILANRA